jgi:hypothetical protein
MGHEDFPSSWLNSDRFAFNWDPNQTIAKLIRGHRIENANARE